MKKYALIVAGGTGTRMKSNIPKQFHLINGKPVLYYTINTFLESYPDLDIILVLPSEHVAAGQEVIDAFFSYDRIRIALGGRTRFHSVQSGLSFVEEESIVLVHDAVRCLVTTDLIRRCYDAVLQFGSAVPAVSSRDSVRLITDDANVAVNREDVKLVQTPQAFYSKILLPAFKIDYKDKFTDEASVVEAFGLKIYLVEGEESNIKITHPVDIMIAERILSGREN